MGQAPVFQDLEMTVGIAIRDEHQPLIGTMPLTNAPIPDAHEIPHEQALQFLSCATHLTILVVVTCIHAQKPGFSLPWEAVMGLMATLSARGLRFATVKVGMHTRNVEVLRWSTLWNRRPVQTMLRRHIFAEFGSAKLQGSFPIQDIEACSLALDDVNAVADYITKRVTPASNVHFAHSVTKTAAYLYADDPADAAGRFWTRDSVLETFPPTDPPKGKQKVWELLGEGSEERYAGKKNSVKLWREKRDGVWREWENTSVFAVEGEPQIEVTDPITRRLRRKTPVWNPGGPWWTPPF